jgi:parvulin-like peptidyl-prolyl isomerase
VEHVALTQALYRRALDAGVHRDPDVRFALAMAEREVLASEFLRAEARRVVTPELVAARYAEMPEFRIEQLRTWHLRLADDADPDALRAAIAASSFGAVARTESSDESTSGAGGDLGWLDRSVVEGAFGPEVAAAPAGALIGPITAAGGTHLVWIESRRDAVPLAEIEAGLTAELEAREMARLTEEVRSDLVVERP